MWGRIHVGVVLLLVLLGLTGNHCIQLEVVISEELVCLSFFLAFSLSIDNFLAFSRLIICLQSLEILTHSIG
jgi:hypothetical protein